MVVGLLRAAAALGQGRQVSARVELSDLQVVEVKLQLCDPVELPALQPGSARA